MKIINCFLLVLSFISCQSDRQMKPEINKEKIQNSMEKGNEIATFAGGCFWCTEAVFLNLKGVESVTSGYIGGKTLNPTYKDICTGETGHAEAIQIVFDPNVVTFGELLEIFFATHDPTTINRQGADVGTQYRSEVFYHNEEQKTLTEEYIQLLLTDATFGFGKRIVTKISPATVFYPAEEYHQNYYNQNTSQGYCSFVITPKIEKLKSQFQSKLKQQ
jgi:peptide-methionine (S)-S-oxide reductase